MTRMIRSRSTGLQMVTKVTKHISRESRLFVLSVLLDYALAESRELALPHLDKLLDAAALAVSDELDKAKALSPKTESSGHTSPSKS